MKLKSVLAISMFLGSGLFVGNAWAAEGCSDATLIGAYGFYRSGVTAMGQLFNEVGIINYDGKGSGSFTSTVSRGDEISQAFGAGTYVVNRDCSFIGYDADGNEIVRGVLVDGGNEAFFLRTNPGAHLIAVLKKVGAKEDCSEATLHGAYGFYRSGVGANPAGVLVDEVAIVNYDGEGNFSTTGTLSQGDVISQTSVVGTYLVNSDCSFIGYIGGVEVYRFVIVDGGKEAFGLRMNPGAHQRSFLKKI